MTQEEPFPNPIRRTDLPRKRRRWPKIVAALAAGVLLIIVFLPQVLATGLGRRLVVPYLESKLGMKVGFRELRTSWWGPTRIQGFWAADEYGTRLAMTRFSGDVSLMQLIRGKYELGKAQVDGLLVDYVVDYGNGRDLIARMTGRSRAPDGPPLPPMTLPELSGQIEVTNGIMRLTRGVILSKPGFPTRFQTVTYRNVSGSLDIKSLDTPWTVKLSGHNDQPNRPDEPIGSFELSGTFDLGEDGQVAPSAGSIDAQVKVANGPSGALGWAIWSLVDPEDYQTMFGKTMPSFSAKVRMSGGRVDVSELVAVGQAANGIEPRLTARLIVDMTEKTPSLMVESPGLQVTAPAAAGVAQKCLAYVNPFLANAVNGTGVVEVSLSKLWIPLTGRRDQSVAAGTLRLSGVQIAAGDDWSGDAAPATLVGQWQSLTGIGEAMIHMDLEPVNFELQSRQMKISAQDMQLGGQRVLLGGEIDYDGQLRMSAGVSLPSASAASVPEANGTLAGSLRGSVLKPRLDVLAGLSSAGAETLRDLIARHIGQQRDRQFQEMKADLDREAEQSMQRLRLLTGSTQPTTR